jgi:hypothetical protein
MTPRVMVVNGNLDGVGSSAGRGWAEGGNSKFPLPLGRGVLAT